MISQVRSSVAGQRKWKSDSCKGKGKVAEGDDQQYASMQALRRGRA